MNLHRATKMALSFALGSSQLMQAGASLSDVALILNFGRRVGNWLRVAGNDEELLDSIGEDPGAVLKRRGLVDVTLMETKWSQHEFMYQGHHHRTSPDLRQSAHTEGRAVEDSKPSSKKKSQSEAAKHPRMKTKQARGFNSSLSSFSWLMTTIVTALDLCLPSSEIQGLLTRVYRRVLNGDQELEDSLRILLPVNIESWRSTGCIKNMKSVVTRALKMCRKAHVGDTALPQLNVAERWKWRSS